MLLGAVALLFIGMSLLSSRVTRKSEAIADQVLADSLLSMQKEKLQVASHSMAVSLARLIEKEESTESKIAILREAIDTIRFESDESGYFFIYQDTTVVALPTKKNLQGKDLAEAKDPGGVYFIKELKDRAIEGGGFVFYQFDKPGVGIVPKLSYAELIPGTEMWIGTGVYIDNIATQQAAFNEVLNEQLLKERIIFFAVSGSVFLFVVLPVSIRIAVSVAKPLELAMKRLHENSGRILGSSTEIANASQTLASGSSEQAASIEETTATVCEIANLSDKNAERAEDAIALMTAANRSIGEVSERIDELHQSMDQISESSAEMQAIIKTIDEIAFQTNILALNAAVEAARAGEAGAGFSVVAEEVRSLAGRSATAARDTAGLIENSVATVGQGTRVMLSARESFAEMRGKTAEVSGILSEIEGYSKEQSSGVREVNLASEQMNQVVQANAAHAEECAASSAQLNKSFRDFGEVISLIEKVVEGAQAGRARADGAGDLDESSGSPVQVAAHGRMDRFASVAEDSWESGDSFLR